MVRKTIIIIFACLINIVFICLSIYVSGASASAEQLSDDEINVVLTSAESLFKAMKGRQYADIWDSLTAKSRKSIVDTVSGESKKRGSNIKEEKISGDFKTGGELARAYWNGYLMVFNPELVLEQSKWTMGDVKENKAEIIILYKKSSNPAKLQLFKENNQWKVGLSETFGSRAMKLAY